MTTSIVNYIIDKYLANILDIDRQQTNASIWKGEVELHNVRIKPKIFDMINLPYMELVNGYIGTLKIKLSMPRFYLYPIQVTVDKVYFHARQKLFDKLNIKEEIENMEMFKKNLLQTIEELSGEIDTLKDEEKGIGKQILKNLQVDIRDIVFRLDDNVSYAQIPYSFGIILKNIHIKSIDGVKEELRSSTSLSKKTKGDSDVNHKHIQIEDFSIFMDCYEPKKPINYITQIDPIITKTTIDPTVVKFLNENDISFYQYCLTELNSHSSTTTTPPFIEHSYLLYCLNMEFHLSLNDNLKNGHPKLYCNILFPNISLSLSLKQLEAISHVISYVNLIQLYRMGIANDFYIKTLSKEEKDIYLNTYLSYYLKKYVKKNTKEPFPRILLDYEKGMSFDSIQSMRVAAFIKLEYQTSIGEINEKISKSKGKWLKRGLSKKSIEELNKQKNELMNNENKVNLEIENQLKSQKKVNVRIDNYPELNDDYLIYHFKCSITLLAFNLIDISNSKDNDKMNDKPTSILNVFFYNFQSESKIFKLAHLFTINLGDFNVSQQIIESKLYPYLIKSTTHNNIDNNNNSTAPIFLLEYEDNPKLPEADYRLKIHIEKQLNIILNLYFINYLSRSLLNIIVNNINFHQIKSYTKGEARKYIQAGYINKFFKGDIQRRSINLNIIITSPIITIPLNIRDSSNSSSIIMTTGNLSLSSKLARRQKIGIDYQAVTDPALLYDKYILTITQIQMKTVNKDSESLLIKDYGIRSEIAMLTEPKNVMFDNMIIETSMSEFDLFIDEDQLNYMALFMNYTLKDNQVIKKTFDKAYETFVKRYAMKEKNKSMIKETKDIDKWEFQKEIQQTQNDNDNDENNNNNDDINNENYGNEGNITRNKITFKFNLSKVTINIMKNASIKEISFRNSDDSNSKQKEYLKFELNTFNLQLLLTEKNNMNLQLKIINLFLYDYDHIITSSSSISSTVHQNFQCLISTTDIIQANQSLTASKINPNQKSFIEVAFNTTNISSKESKHITNLIIILNKLAICPNIISLTRLNKFLNYYIDLFNEKLLDLTDNEQNNLIEHNLSYDYKKYDILNKQIAKDKDQRINPIFFNKVKSNMKENKRNNKDSQSSLEKLQQKINNEIKKEDESNNKSSMHKEKIIVSFILKDIELLMPINPLIDNTSVLDFKLDMTMKFKQKNQIERITSIKTNELIRENYHIRNIDMTSMIYNIKFNMIQITAENIINSNSINERLLLSNSRITILLKSFLLLSTESIASEIQITIEPMEIYIGFKELQCIKQLNDLSTQSIIEMNRKYSPDYQLTFTDDSTYGLFGKGIEMKSKAFIEDHAQSTQDKALNIKNLQSKFDKAGQKLRKKIENDKLYNISTFNEYLDLKVMFNKGIIHIYNSDTTIKQILAEIVISNIGINYIKNSDPIDSINMGNALVEMISGKEVPISEFNINNLHQYLDFTSHFAVNYYNDSLRKYEPFIEPWIIDVSMTQVAEITRRRMDIMCNMLNINCTSSSIKFLNLVLKKFLSESEDNQPILNAIDINKNDKDIIVEFENATGIPIVYWFDCNANHSITIQGNEIHSYTKESLKEIIGIDAEMNHLQRDKFSWRIDKESNTIEGVDYSFNQHLNINMEIMKNKSMITLKVMTINTKRKIMFGSGIEIVNNTEFDDMIISNEKEKQSIPLGKDKKMLVPLKWIIDKQKVFMQLHQEDKKVLMYEHMSPFTKEEVKLKEVFYKKVETNKNISKNNATPKDKEIKTKGNVQNPLEKNYAKTLRLHNSKTNENVYVAIDYIALSSNNETETETNNELQSNDNKNTPLPLSSIKPLNYIITINPPFLFKNLIPYELSYTQILTNNKTQSHSMKPLATKAIYSMIPYSTQFLLILSLKYNKMAYTSLTIHPNNLNGIILFSSNNQSIKCNLISQQSSQASSKLQAFFSSSFSTIVSSKSSSQTILFTINYIITNRLNSQVFLKPINNDNAIDTTLDYQQYRIAPNSLSLISTNSTKMSMKSDTSEWSLPFNINTHGIEGVVSLEQINTSQFKPKNKEASDVAVIIASLKHFPHTTMIILEPRYLLINNLGFDIDYKQKDQEKIYYLSNNQTEELVYRNNDRYFSIGVNGHYSTLFNVDDIESFDLQLPITKEDVNNASYKGLIYTLDDNKYYLLIRVILQSYDNGLIYIMFTLPSHPFLEVDNMTDKHVIIMEAEYTSHNILPNRKVPFIWNDTLSITKTLKCCIAGTEQLFSFSRFDKIIKVTNIEDCYGEKIKYQITVTNDSYSNTRTLRLQKIDSHLSHYNAVQKVLLGYKMPKITKYNAIIEGVGISIIDDLPKEIFYISLYGIEVKYSNNILKNQDIIENTMNIMCYMKNFQVDYCLNNSFHNIIFPKIQILPSNEELLLKEANDLNTNVFPFIQLLICKQTVSNLTNDDIMIKYPQVDLTIQEFNVKIEQYALINLIHIIQFYMTIIDFYKSNTSMYCDNLIIDNESLLQSNIIIPKDDLIKGAEDNKKMLMMNYLLLSAIKINLTLRIDLSQLDMSLIPGFIMQIIGTVGNTLTRITDTPLCFKETVYENVFIDIGRIITLLIDYYKQQGIRQIYKVLGSNDLIGNPIKLVENIGTGFSEFFNEPRKGFLKGPTQFGKGLAKGVTSLVSHVLSGGFGVVSSTSGTLLAAAKTLQKSNTTKINESLNYDTQKKFEEDEPDNVLIGVVDGLKGGCIELGKGVSGVFMNPYRNGKAEGVKGVMKGIGTGLLGALISPLTAVLTFVTSSSEGIKNTFTLQKNRIKTIRIRYPRVIIANEPLQQYDPILAEMNEMVHVHSQFLNAEKQRIIFYSDYLSTIKGIMNTVILTDKQLIVLHDAKTIIFKIKVIKVKKCEVHLKDRYADKNKCVLLFIKKNGKRKGVEIRGQNICYQIYDVFKHINNDNNNTDEKQLK